MTRSRLPSRREAITERVEIAGRTWHVTVGPVPGPIREVFAHGPKGDLAALVQDALILASVLLQSGNTLADLTRFCGSQNDGEPASLIGEVLAAASKIEEEMGCQ